VDIASDHDLNLRLREQRDALESALRATRHALIQTVHAMSAVAARRDRYTALHQERVAILSQALGRRLGLSESQLEGVYLGALIHDLGKIAIPSDVLNKPGALTSEERALVKTHVQVGCEILQNVDLPWPIHAIVGQHHERLDGSGYPGGLAATAILLEARIVAVADVFQALCEYRPYRQALGVRPALEKLEAEAGVAFDADVVSALKEVSGAEHDAAELWSRLVQEEQASTVILHAMTTSTLASG
jgi:putative nucleotidyltransferase with HDIG domain